MTLFESEKESDEGNLVFRVLHCRRCGLHRLECGSELRELDPAIWEEQMAEWAGWTDHPS